ncbi:hypothetical protein ABW20_dc0103813 [Dactylellina cionopaga]|nr:hypothetical protein ABW20_dc0103813 [Dactylellina cionopaga]
MPPISYLSSETKLEAPDFYDFKEEVYSKEWKVPEGFPAQYKHERVWIGSEIASQPDKWTFVLTEEEQNAVVDGLKRFQALDAHPSQISPVTFPLPSALSDRLKQVSQNIYNGCGFGIVRGLNPDSFTEEENTLVFAGLSAHIASQRGFQDSIQEAVICHVVSEELNPKAEGMDMRPAFTNGVCSFHTDVGDILGLYAVELPASGGETLLASSSQAYNELAASRPDLLHELVQKWAFFHSQNYQLDGTPLLNNAPGDKLVFNYSRIPVTGFRTEGPNPTLPPPSEKRLEAMDLINKIMTKNAFAPPRERGDILYFNNLCLMHARNAFDLDETGKPLPSKRHLIKLVLRDPELKWDMPEYLKSLDKHVYEGNRDDGSRVERWQLVYGQAPPAYGGKIYFGGGVHCTANG